MQDNNIQAPYCLMTFHRPINVDTVEQLRTITDIIVQVAQRMTVVFPIHPRTLKNLELFGLKQAIDLPAVKLIPPQGYIEFIRLMKESAMVISDSGGVQIETSYFGVPCFTVRDTTELKITIDKGTNQLVPLDAGVLTARVDAMLASPKKARQTHMEWDGMATERIVTEITAYLR
jgi:UDP-N-acetylglucosamine 2-epimerase (non-hydrolysing)